MTSAVFICILALALVGCAKKESAAPEASAAATNETETAVAAEPSAEAAAPASLPASSRRAFSPRPAPAPAAPVAAANEELVGIVDNFMTAQLKKFIAEKGRLPKDFSEFANARMDSVPRAPAGLKYAIDPTTQQVKLVRK